MKSRVFFTFTSFKSATKYLLKFFSSYQKLLIRYLKIVKIFMKFLIKIIISCHCISKSTNQSSNSFLRNFRENFVKDGNNLCRLSENRKQKLYGSVRRTRGESLRCDGQVKKFSHLSAKRIKFILNLMSIQKLYFTFIKFKRKFS